MDEMKGFFGCRIAMECLLYKDIYEQYWRNKDNLLTVTPGIPENMPQDRFLAIWSLLHCVDERDQGLDKNDKIYKSRPIFTYLIRKFKRYYVPNCELSLDEGMIPTKNSLSIKQYTKDKPIKWGIKTFLLCDSHNGYICGAEVYTGKVNDQDSVDNLGVTGNLLRRLTDSYQDQDYCVYVDRFYTSVTLCEYLLEKGIRLVGTAMTNRKNVPKTLIKKRNAMQRGASETLFNGNIGAIVWQDKRPIYFVTSSFVN